LEASNNTIGGTSTYAGNYIGGNRSSGIAIVGSEERQGLDAAGNTLQGNGIGIGATGRVVGNEGDGVFLQNARGNLIGGSAASAGNKIDSNGGSGIEVGGLFSRLNVIQGNWIGPYGNAINGIIILDGSDNTIGGLEAGSGNVINNNGEAGIAIVGATANANTIQRNTISFNDGIGVVISDASNSRIGGNSAQGLGNTIQRNRLDGIILGESSNSSVSGNLIEFNRSGIVIAAGSNNLVGGTAEGLANQIRNNSGGVLVSNSAGNAILSNSIAGNFQFGIDLTQVQSETNVIGVGPTPNDLGDADDGGNHFQNYPVITSVTVNGSQTTIVGTLNTTPTAEIVLQFFGNQFVDDSGYGQGETYLGQAIVTTNAAGNATFSAVLPVKLTPGTSVSATATSRIGGIERDTSEFSAVYRIPTIELQLNRFSESHQTEPKIVTDGTGNYVVIWKGWNGVGSTPRANSVLYRRFDAAGNPLDPGEYVANIASMPFSSFSSAQVDVAMNSRGEFVIVWSYEDLVV
jgi:parallel beta-helix repeat protein